jgi:hypothetical protein
MRGKYPARLGLTDWIPGRRPEHQGFALNIGGTERPHLAREMPQRASDLARMHAVMPAPNPAYDPAKADQGLAGVEPREL